MSVVMDTPEKVYLADDAEFLLNRVFIGVEPTTHVSPDEWFVSSNEEVRRQQEARGDTHIASVLERRIKIDDYDAVVTYPRDEVESFPEEKLTVLIKNGMLFRIATAYIDHEKIWNSFRFEE